MTYRIVEEVFPRDAEYDESGNLLTSDLDARLNGANDYDDPGDDIRNYARVQIMTQPVDHADTQIMNQVVDRPDALQLLSTASTLSTGTTSTPSSEFLANSSESSQHLTTSCPHCPTVFGGSPPNQRRNLRRHLFGVHSTKTRLSCPVPDCPAIFSRSDNLKAHMQSLHAFTS